ncbi:MAG: stage II sporulation protein M [Verrucomicrobia bacterium]|nr:stage II sporulation protein M [Verrucomicrobiota bacterium]
MNSAEFEQENQPRWQRLEEMIEGVEKGRAPENVEELPTLFRQTCHDLSIAQHRIFGMGLVERLNNLAIRGFRTLERRAGGGWESLFRMILVKFPKMVRAEWRLFWFCSFIFWGPFLAFAIWTPHDPEWAMSLLGPETMVSLETMYGEHTSPQDFIREEYGSDFMMFCHYINNNVGIDLRTFAGGLLGGVGALLILLFNGLQLGASTGYIHHACNPSTFYSFTSGHSAPELIGIVISGMAGMRLGLALLIPGLHDRKTALVLGGRKAMTLITGAVTMTFLAACIEGFWSAHPMEPWIKYTFGGVVWLITISYLALCGRRVADET